MPRVKFSAKHLQIDKANATMVAVIAGVAFVTVFSIVSCQALLNQRGYLSRVIAANEKTKKQLNADLKATQSLTSSYQAFVSAPENAIAGSSTGGGDRDGDNARLVLDALPSKYDFPALATSIEKILTGKNFKVSDFAGTDDQVAQQANDGSATPQPLEIPFQLTIQGNYSSVQDLIKTFDHSIRPISILSVEFSGSDAEMHLQLSAKTYYQPEKTFKVTTKDIK